MTNIRNLFAAWAGLLLGLNLCAQNTPFDSIPFELGTDHRVYVSCRVNGSAPLRFLFDTGSDRVVDLNTPFVERHRLIGTQQPFAISHIASSDTNSGVLENVFLIRFS